MRLFLFNSIFLILFFTFNCDKVSKCQCEVESTDTISACGVVYPVKNIIWLKNMKTSLENDNSLDSAGIILYSKENIDYFFIIHYRIRPFDRPFATLFNCDGTPKYSCGGIQPIDSCKIFLKNAQKKATLWIK